MNPHYETLEQILRLDVIAGAATKDWRMAQKELSELAKRTESNEELLAKTKADMTYHEAELRRSYKRLDELEEKKLERSSRLFAARNDDEHRAYKRDLDNVEREVRDIQRRLEETENRIEGLKALAKKTRQELQQAHAQTASERDKAESSQKMSAEQLSELNSVRETYLNKMDDRVQQHYRRLTQITRNPNGPINRVTDGACGNCHIGLAPQLINNITRGKDVEFCPNCHHILLPQSHE